MGKDFLITRCSLLAMVAAASAFWPSNSRAAVDVTFAGAERVTLNSPINVGSQLRMVASSDDLSSSLLVLSFYNSAVIDSSLTDIYIDAPPAGPDSGDGVINPYPNPYMLLTGVIDSGDDVAFAQFAKPINLPGANMADPDFVVSSGLSADSDSPVAPNGIDKADEWVRLTFTLQGNLTFADAIQALNGGEMRVGVKMQALPNGESDTYIIVPEPTTLVAAALLLLPFAGSSLRFLRQNRRSR